VAAIETSSPARNYTNSRDGERQAVH
jgi:hypothetical protein